MIVDRILYFDKLFDDLMSTNSRLEKEATVRAIPQEYKEDFMFIVECLAGRHPFGYTFVPFPNEPHCEFLDNWTYKELLSYLLEPVQMHDLSVINIIRHCKAVGDLGLYVEPIVNRTLRLGIGRSLLTTDELTPMLAKKYEGDIAYDKAGYCITEKLDGNRCIAFNDGITWQFKSRNGKDMYVDFDMSGFDPQYVYDGEVLSKKQVELSSSIYWKVVHDVAPDTTFGDEFNNTSGMINRHTTDKDLVYNVFDVVDSNMTYLERRMLLSEQKPSEDVRILPALKVCDNADNLRHNAYDLLNIVTSIGGEGIMINSMSRKYDHCRTDSLLKLKKAYSIDMKVIDIEFGSGKYEGSVGAIVCECDGIHCKVGTGLSDSQRVDWAMQPEKIIGKIVEVEYFSTSKARGAMTMSLRFPRLKQVRTDKGDVSKW